MDSCKAVFPLRPVHSYLDHLHWYTGLSPLASYLVAEIYKCKLCENTFDLFCEIYLVVNCKIMEGLERVMNSQQMITLAFSPHKPCQEDQTVRVTIEFRVREKGQHRAIGTSELASSNYFLCDEQRGCRETLSGLKRQVILFAPKHLKKQQILPESIIREGK